MFLVHLLKDLHPHPVVNLAVLDRIEHLLDILLALEREFVFKHHFDQADQCVFHMDLDEAEVLIALIFEDLGEESDIVLFLDVGLHTVDDSGCPLNDKRLQAVLLVQVGVHELLQSFFADLVLGAFLVEFDFLSVHVCDGVFKLLAG